jgi:DNA mismatch endonuclease, patch repair protein
MSRSGTPAPSDLSTALRMRGQRQRDTACEVAVRRLLHSWGLRFRIDCRPEQLIARRADIVFRPAKTAVFVDGCFWHGCPLHWKTPKRNGTWWAKKISANAKRDRQTDSVLERGGWLVIRAWEHEDPVAVATRIAEAVQRRRAEFANKPIRV